MTDGLLEALNDLSSWSLLIFFSLGVLNGLVSGLLPGLGGSVGIALMIPLTYGVGLTEAMVLFVAAMSGQTFAGSIGAILLNIPGSAPAAATALDGYPLAKQGRAGFAIGISAAASALGTVIGCVLVLLLFPVIRSLLLSFGYPEFTMMGVLGLTAIAIASRGSLLKGLMAGAVGFVVSMVGYSPIGNQLRFTFEQNALWTGISLVSVLIGVFAVTEVAQLLATNQTIAKNSAIKVEGHREVFAGVVYVLKQPWLLVKSSLLGTGIGAIPGLGGTVAAFMAYFQAEKTIKDNYFGKGDPRGVLAPEAAADGKEAGAALPSMAFGIPGSAEWAIVLGAMILHGVNPGPQLAQNEPSLIWIVIIVIAAASVVTSLLGLGFATRLIKLTRVRPGILGPIVAALALIGAYALEFKVLDVFIAVIFGLIGYLMVRNLVPVVPLILGLVLGASVESWYLRSLALSDTGHLVFVTRPISAVLLTLTLALIASEFFAARKRRRTMEQTDALDADALRPRPSGTFLFAAMGVVGAVAVQQSTQYASPADQFPLYIGLFMLVGSVLYLAIALVPAVRRRLWPVLGEGTFLEPVSDAEAGHELAPALGRAGAGASTETVAVVAEGPQAVVVATTSAHGRPVLADRLRTYSSSLGDLTGRRREVLAVTAQVLFAVAIAVLGLWVAVPLFLAWGVRVFGRESWRTVTVVTVVTTVILYVGFVVLLNVPMHYGLFELFRG